MRRPRCSRVVGAGIIISFITLLLSYIIGIAICNSSKGKIEQGTKLHLENDIERDILAKLNQVSQNLAATHRMTRGEAANRVQFSYHLLQEVIYKINPKLTIPSTEKDVKINVIENSTTDVCPEVYKGSKYGYPYYYDGFVETDCTNVKPLSDVVSILLNFVDYPEDNEISTNSILEGIEKSYPNISVIVAKNEDLDLPSMKGINVQTKVYSKSPSAGQIWNELIQAATSKYVLIGRDITSFDWNSRLTRLIREADYLNILAAGGATRTPDGHWSLSCLQVVYKNYTFAYRAGYDISQHGCIYCGYITGPFVSRTKVLLKVVFDKDLSSDVVFQDFFIRLYKQNTLSVVCPDSMYYVLDRSKSLGKKETWIPIAQKWQLSQIRLENGEKLVFTENDYKVRCNMEKGLAVAPICLQKLADATKFFLSACEDNNIYCEITDGTLMGAVKFSKVLPWERDADVSFVKENYSAVKTLSNVFKDAGYTLSNVPFPNNIECCFVLKLSGWYVELWGMELNNFKMLLSKSMTQTKVNFDGMWVNAPLNPGLWVRNRYGHEVFKHSQHWGSLGHSTSWELYQPSKFSACPNAGAHNCLDQYLTDGNLQFRELIP